MHTFIAVDEVGRELAEKVVAAPSAGHPEAVTWAREVERLTTVQNPYSRGVDATTGQLFIAGLSGGVVHILGPAFKPPSVGAAGSPMPVLTDTTPTLGEV